MRHALLTAVAPLLVAASAHAATRGDGNKTTVIRPTDAPFAAMNIEGPLDLTVSEGTEHRVTVTIDENLQPFVEIAVEDGTLEINVTEHLKYRGKGSVAVTLPQLTSLERRGSGDTEVTTSEKPRELKIDSSGSGDLVATVSATKLDLDVQGSGSIAFSGPVEEIVVEIEGSGDVSYNGSAGTIYVELRGSGDIDLSGKADSLRVSASGSGDIDARSMKIRDALLMMTSSGDAKVTMTGGRLLAKLRGSGDLNWWGTAQVEAASTGSGEIIRH